MAEKFRFSFSWWADSTVEISLFTGTSNENQGLLSFAQSHRRTLKNSKTLYHFHYSWINSWQMISSQAMS